MRRRDLSDGDLHRLLSGSVDPDDAPPSYQRVAEAVRAARGAARSPLPLSPEAVPIRRARRRAGKVAVVALVAMAVSSTLTGFDALPSAASEFTGFVLRGLVEFGTNREPDKPDMAPESPPSQSQAPLQGSQPTDTRSDLRPAEPVPSPAPTHSPPADGQPAPPGQSKPENKPNSSNSNAPGSTGPGNSTSQGASSSSNSSHAPARTPVNPPRRGE
ncbi:MAG: hypothetical protein QOG39_180 [Acidimicrobiaceae bacterium]